MTDKGTVRIKTQGGRLKRETDGLLCRAVGAMVWTWSDLDLDKPVTVRVDRLVLQAFRPAEGKRRPRHINGDKCDSRLENLEWA